MADTHLGGDHENTKLKTLPVLRRQGEHGAGGSYKRPSSLVQDILHQVPMQDMGAPAKKERRRCMECASSIRLTRTCARYHSQRSTTGDATMSYDDIIKEIKSLEGVENATLWARVPGKERVYVDTVKLNGGKNWNCGLGYNECSIDLNTGDVVMRGEAGARTRKYHKEKGTEDALKGIAARYMATTGKTYV